MSGIIPRIPSGPLSGRPFLLVAALLVAPSGTISAQTLVNPFLSGDRSSAARPTLPAAAEMELFVAETCAATANTWENAARRARHHPAAFDSALATWQRAPDAARQLARPPLSDSDYEAVYLALLASDPTRLEETVAGCTEPEPESEEDAESLRQNIQQDAESLRLELERAERRLSPRQAALFASGSIRGLVASDGEETSSETGTGALGLQIDFSSGEHHRAVTGLVVVASASEIVRGDFGTSMLSPGTAGAFESGLLDIQWGVGRRLVPSIHGYLAYSRLNWALGESDGDEIAGEVDLLSAGLLVSRAIARGRLFDTSVSLVIEAGPAFRLVDAEDGLLNRALQDDEKRAFLLLESGMSVTFGPATAGISGFWGGGGSVDGLSGFNVMAGMSVEAPFVSGVLSEGR